MTRVTVDEYDVQDDWRCGSCGRVCPGMDGTERRSLKCTNCGHEKTAEDPWIERDADGPRLTGEKAQWAALGENVHCPYCKAANRADERVCIECGFVIQRVDAPRWMTPDGLPPKPKRNPVMVSESAPPRKPYVPPAPPVAPPRRVLGVPHILGGLGAILGLAALVALLVWGLSPNETTVVVTSRSWSRSVTPYEQHEYPGQGWADQVPIGSFGVTQQNLLQRGTHACNPHQGNCRYLNNCNCRGGGTERCNPHPEDQEYNCRREVDRNNCTRTRRSNGNGSSKIRIECETRRVCDTRRVTVYEECRVPRVCERCLTPTCETVYDRCPTMVWWVTYRYHQWDAGTTSTVTQRDAEEPFWPQARFSGLGFPRRQETSESYAIHFRDLKEPRTWDLTVSLSQFGRYTRGQTWEARWSSLGGITPLHPILNPGQASR